MSGINDDGFFAAESRRPRCTITPIYGRNPPEHFTTIPPVLDRTMVPLPASANIAVAVCLPFYSEPGYTLSRSLQALALQRADMQRYATVDKVAFPQPRPEIHVFAVADGWRKADGSSILSDSMFDELLNLYGSTLDVDALLRYMGDRVDDDEAGGGGSDEEGGSTGHGGGGGGGRRALPDHVLLQFVVPAGPDEPPHPTGTVLEPLALDVTWAAGMHARKPPTTGRVTRTLAAAARKEVKRRQQQQRAAALAAKAAADKALAAETVPAESPSGKWSPWRTAPAVAALPAGGEATISVASESVSNTRRASLGAGSMEEGGHTPLLSGADVHEVGPLAAAAPLGGDAGGTGPTRRSGSVFVPREEGTQARQLDWAASGGSDVADDVSDGYDSESVGSGGELAEYDQRAEDGALRTPERESGGADLGVEPVLSAHANSGVRIEPLFVTIMIKRESESAGDRWRANPRGSRRE